MDFMLKMIILLLLGYYGESKLGGENLLKDSNIDYAILRTILVYGKHKKPNIVLKVKKWFREWRSGKSCR